MKAGLQLVFFLFQITAESINPALVPSHTCSVSSRKGVAVLPAGPLQSGNTIVIVKNQVDEDVHRPP